MARRETIRSMLATGNRFASGRVREVAALILSRPKSVARLIECLWDEDAGVANRAADALERASRHHPHLAAPWKDSLLGLLAEAQQNKLRWNLALVVPRFVLSPQEARRAAQTLRTYLDDKSSIVKTCAMQGMAELSRHDPSLLPEVLDLLRVLSRTGTPAMRARGRILLRRFERADLQRVRSHKSKSIDSPG